SARSFCAPRKPTCHSLSSGCTSPTGSRVDEYGDSVERLGQSDGCCCRPAEVGGSSPGAETRPARIRLPAPAASAGIVAPLGGPGWFPGRFLQVAPRLPRRFLQVEPPHGDSPWPGADRLRSRPWLLAVAGRAVAMLVLWSAESRRQGVRVRLSLL